MPALRINRGPLSIVTRMLGSALAGSAPAEGALAPTRESSIEADAQMLQALSHGVLLLRSQRVDQAPECDSLRNAHTAAILLAWRGKVTNNRATLWDCRVAHRGRQKRRQVIAQAFGRQPHQNLRQARHIFHFEVLPAFAAEVTKLALRLIAVITPPRQRTGIRTRGTGKSQPQLFEQRVAADFSYFQVAEERRGVPLIAGQRA